MKTAPVYFLALATAATLLSAGCATSGARAPVAGVEDGFESTAKFALMDSRAQTSVTCTGLQEGKTEDGRLQVAANLRNRENRRIEVQVQCLFKDPQGFALDETPWQTLILTENGQETVRFAAMNTKATDYEVRVRGAR
jgi:hypothetical protein